MTDDEARTILRAAGGLAYIAWDNEANRPRWDSHGYILIDGEVSAAELLALLHFAPDAGSAG